MKCISSYCLYSFYIQHKLHHIGSIYPYSLWRLMSYIACLFRQVSGYYYNLGLVSFLPHPFQFVIQCHLIMQCCLFRATESISNKYFVPGPLCSLCTHTCCSLTLAWSSVILIGGLPLMGHVRPALPLSVPISVYILEMIGG